MNVPRNVLWFEVLLYLSLTLDAVSVALQDRTPTADMTEQMINVATVMAAGLILLLVYFVWLAAQRRKNWPRWVLAAALVLSVISLVQVIGESGVQLDSGIEIVSCALTAAGLYFSFTGDAHGLVQRVSAPSFRGDAKHRTRSRNSRCAIDGVRFRCARNDGSACHRRNPVNSAHGMDRRRHRAGRAAAWRILRHRRAADARATAAISAWCAAAPARGCGRCCSPATASRAVWRARLDEHLGTYAIEGTRLRAATLLASSHAVYGVTHLASLARLLPERDPHEDIYEMLDRTLDDFDDAGGAAVHLVRFELAMLAELGFGLDLENCAATGETTDLIYVSPKSGGAVSRQAGEPWRDRLLRLPPFLREGEGGANGWSDQDLQDGFRLTGLFLLRHVLEPRGQGHSDARDGFINAVTRNRARISSSG